MYREERFLEAKVNQKKHHIQRREMMEGYYTM